MIFPFKDEEEETRPWTSEPQSILEDPTPTAPVTQLASVIAKEEDIEVPAEELESTFFSPSANLTSSPISKYVQAVHEHLDGTFPIDPAISSQLQTPLLKVAKLADIFIATEVKEVCQ